MKSTPPPCSILVSAALVIPWLSGCNTKTLDSAAQDTDVVDADNDGVMSDEDCDDLDASVYPGALEVCDGVDNDCDDETDEGVSTTYYADSDGDGFGAEDNSTEACSPPSGYVPNENDCDDTNGSIHPGAVEECDGIDNDCDEDLDPCIDLSLADTQLFGLEEDDDAGFSLAGLGDLNGDGLADIAIGARNESTGGSGAGAIYVVHGPVTQTESLANAAGIIIGETSGDAVGTSVAGAGDTNGDSIPDIVVGAWGNYEGGSYAGAAYLVTGPVTGAIALDDVEAKLIGEHAGDSAGYDVAGGGDINGDGLMDILVGAHNATIDGYKTGSVYVSLGPLTNERSLEYVDAQLIGSDDGDAVGYSIDLAEDIDGDGLDDIIVGAYGADIGGDGSGAVYVVLGPASGISPLEEADHIFVGTAEGEHAGVSVAYAGDCNGDGQGDLIIGAPDEDSASTNAGVAYLIVDPESATLNLEESTARLIGEQEGDRLGSAVSSGGDVDGDGRSEIMAGAPRQDAGGTNAGAAYLLFGPISGNVDLTEADVKFIGENEGDGAGDSTAGAGDVNGDGLGDLLVGAPSESTNGDDAGSAYILFGMPNDWL